VFLSKFSEGINRSPLYIQSPEIKVDDLIFKPIIDESVPKELKFILFYHEIFEGRISQFFFGLLEFVFQIIMSISPSWEALFIYCLIIFPERCTQVFDKISAVGLKVNVLTKCWRFILSNYPIVMVIALCGLTLGIAILVYELVINS